MWWAYGPADVYALGVVLYELLDDAAREPESAFAVQESDFGLGGGETQVVVRQLIKVSEQRTRPQDVAKWRARVL
jgi:hypothetical protein